MVRALAPPPRRAGGGGAAIGSAFAPAAEFAVAAAARRPDPPTGAAGAAAIASMALRLAAASTLMRSDPPDPVWHAPAGAPSPPKPAQPALPPSTLRSGAESARPSKDGDVTRAARAAEGESRLIADGGAASAGALQPELSVYTRNEELRAANVQLMLDQARLEERLHAQERLQVRRHATVTQRHATHPPHRANHL